MRYAHFGATALALRVELCESRLLFSASDHGLDDVADRPIEVFDETVATFLADAHRMSGVAATRNAYGLSGQGQTVAIIDSGVAYDHYALGGGFGPGFRVVGGYDFTEENDADPYDDAPSGFHGTHVAGIIGSSHEVHTGVAPEVDLVALRTFNDHGDGDFRWVEMALNWVHRNKDAFPNPITTVNLSLGTQWNSSVLPRWATLEDELARLDADGMFITVSAGNDFPSYKRPGLSYPAVSPHVVPAASITQLGSFSPFSQRHDRVIAAPGHRITSTVPDYLHDFDGKANDFATVSGTSMAAPYLAGASVVLRQAMELVGQENVNQEQLYDLFRETADVFYDPVTRASYHRLNLENALDAVLPEDDYGSTAADAHSIGTLTTTSLSIGGMINRTDDQDYFRFLAGQNGLVTLTTEGTHEVSITARLVGGAVATQGQLQFPVIAGQSYTLRISTNDGIGFYTGRLQLERSANEVAAVGTATVDDGLLEVVGSDGDDEFSIHSGEFYTVAVNGIEHTFTTHSLDHIELQGGAGHDVLRVVSSANDERVIVRPGQLSITQPGLQITGHSLENVNVVGGGGNDVATIHDSPGDDWLVAFPNDVRMTGPGFTHQLQGFQLVSARSSRGGNDRAYIHDSAGDDRFVGTPEMSRLSGANFQNVVHGFDRVYAYADRGGQDHAYLYDSANNDSLIARPDQTGLSGDGFHNVVDSFERVYAYAENGGIDRAFMYDSDGDDSFVSRSNFGRLSGERFYNYASGFDRLYAYSVAGGYDRARLYDSSVGGQLTTSESTTRIEGNDYTSVVEGFERLHVHASDGRVVSLQPLSFNDNRLPLSAKSSRLRQSVVNANVVDHIFQQHGQAECLGIAFSE